MNMYMYMYTYQISCHIIVIACHDKYRIYSNRSHTPISSGTWSSAKEIVAKSSRMHVRIQLSGCGHDCKP